MPDLETKLLEQCRPYWSFDIGHCNYFGNIPQHIGNLRHFQQLKQLRLHNNKLSGGIPESLGKLVNLEWLNLSNNELSGSIPNSIGNLLNLRRLDLNDNDFSGSIPTTIGNLVNLETLQLQNNGLSGTVPQSIGNLVNLKSLNLENNELAGRIPASMKALPHICVVNISWNYFSAEKEIPRWKCEEAFRKDKLEEELCKQIIEKVNKELLVRNIRRNGIEGGMKRGEISMGFSDCLVWPGILEKMKELPIEQKENEQQVEKLKKEEQIIIDKLKKLEAEKTQLAMVLKNTQEKKKIFERRQSEAKYILKSIQIIQNMVETEKELAKRMGECRLSEEEFTAKCSGETPLSLVFNAIGLSENSIKKLQFMDEFEFLNTNIQIECRNHDIPIREQFELAYCQKLWINQGVFPNNAHEDECVVCAHRTPEELCYLIEEYKKPFDMDWINRERITGRQFIGMPATSIRSIFPNNKEFQSTWKYFQRIHSQSIKSGALSMSIRPKPQETQTKKPAVNIPGEKT